MQTIQNKENIGVKDDEGVKANQENDEFRNKNLPFEQIVASMLEFDEKLELSIPADYSLAGKYETSALYVTNKQLISFDSGHNDGVLQIYFGKIEYTGVERMYGNSFFYVVTDKGETKLNRFSNKVVDLFEAVSEFINLDLDKEESNKKQTAPKDLFNKKRNRCAKCGRTLRRNSSLCPSCIDKRKVIVRLINYILPHWKRALTALFFSIITTLASLMPPYLTKVLVDDVLTKGNLQRLQIIVIFLLMTFAIEAIGGGIKGYLLRSLAEKIVLILRTQVFSKAQLLTIKYYDKSSTGSIMSRISNDTQQLQSFILRISQDVFIQFLTLIGIIVIMFSLNWQLTLLSFIPVPLVIIGSKIFAKRMRPLYLRMWRRRSKLNSILSDTIPAIRIIKAFTSEQRTVELYEKQSEELLNEQLRAAKTANIYSPIVSFIVMLGGLVIWGLGGYWVITSPEKLSLGILVAFIAYMGRFYGPVQFFANLNDSAQQALTAAERVFEILDAEPEPDFGKGVKVDGIKGELEFKNVSFFYEKSKNVLNNINLKIKLGETIGIVGATGSGKSTIANLLLRFYDPSEGKIILDGIDTKELDLEYLRLNIGYVLQEPILFRENIRNNIAYSRPEASMEEVIQAAKIANAHNFICKFPDAYDTMLGERGVGLSGGERQRISIARAILKNPRILVLDEATASVDSETEKLIQEAIERLIQNRTTIIIAHRLSTLKKADRIVVMEDGCIVELGTHEELMEKQGKFYNMVKMQELTGKDMFEGVSL